MSYRCPDCFSDWEQHDCRCRGDCLEALEKLTSMELWDASIKIRIYYSPRRSSLVFLHDTARGKYASAEERISDEIVYPKYVEFPTAGLLPAEVVDLESLRRRIAESFAFGRSSVFDFDGAKLEAEMNQLIENLMIELAIRERLAAHNLTARLSGDYLAFQRMLNGTCVAIGPKQKMKCLAEGYVRDERHPDAAHSLLAVPFHWLLNNKKRILSMLNEEVEELRRHGNHNVPSPVDGHLSYTLKNLCKLSGERLDEMGFGPRDSGLYFIVTFTIYEDRSCFSLPGGKREVAETSWECALRETKEETGIDLLEEGVKFRDQPSTVRAQCEWTVLAQLALPIDSPGSSVFFVVNSAPLIPCREFFSTGSCRYGEACIFRHDGDPPTLSSWEDDDLSEPCWYIFSNLPCPLGDGCTFRHTGAPPAEDWMLKHDPRKPCWNFFANGTCNFGDACSFRHTGNAPTKIWLDANDPRDPCWFFFTNGTCSRIDCGYMHTGPKPTQEWMVKHDPRKPCDAFFSSGYCRFGYECNRRHTGDPPTQVSKITIDPRRPCWFFFSDRPCPFGSGCTFRHTGKAPTQTWLYDNDPRKPCKYFFLNGLCRYGDACTFRHAGAPPSTPSSRSSNNPPRLNGLL